MSRADPASSLDPKLEADTVPLGELPVSRVRLMDDARFPWVVLVPRGAGLVELTDLPSADLHALMDEVAAASTALRAITGCDKINIGALGNIVRQLHVHVIARFEGDAAWPGAVWGVGSRAPYEPSTRERLVDGLRRHLGVVAAA